MVLFWQPSQDRHSINCSFLGHKAKSHFINSHYSTKPFLTPFPPPSYHAQEASQLNSSRSSWYHPSHWRLDSLCREPIQVAFKIHQGLWHISVITWIPTPPLATINSSDTSGGPGAFPVFISFNAKNTPSLLTQTTGPSTASPSTLWSQ